MPLSRNDRKHVLRMLDVAEELVTSTRAAGSIGCKIRSPIVRDVAAEQAGLTGTSIGD